MYPKPYLTSDIVCLNYQEEKLCVLLIKRKDNPYKDHWALPGGFVDITDEDIYAGAVRELKEETNLDVDREYLVPQGLYSKQDRDPRGWTVSQCFSTYVMNTESMKAGDDAKEAAWFPVEQLNSIKLAFDHDEMIEQTLKGFSAVPGSMVSQEESDLE